MNVLVLSKEKHIKLSLADMLYAMGIKAITSNTSEDFLTETLINSNPDIIILDIYFDTLKHTRLINNIKHCLPNATIVVTSASYNKVAVINALSVGVRHFLIKPFREDEVRYVIDNIVKEKSLCLV